MLSKLILNNTHLNLTINRLCHQLIESHDDFQNSALIGLQPRGIFLGQRIKSALEDILGGSKVLYGELDATFFRDDFRRREKVLVPNSTDMDFLIENKKVVLIDDVLYTGRTIRAGLDALQAFGRPRNVELLVLIDRRYSRHLPIEPNYTGKVVDSIASEQVKVEWDDSNKDSKVWLLTPEDNE